MPAPLVERVEPSKERPLPISRDLMAEEPLPTRMPPSGVVQGYAVALPTVVVTAERLGLVVTGAALPETEPVMREEKVLAPEKVLEAARSVVEATVMLAVPLKETPLMVRAVSRVRAGEA